MKCPVCGTEGYPEWIIFNHGPFFPNVFRFCTQKCPKHGCYAGPTAFPRPHGRPRVARFMVEEHNIQRIRNIEDLQAT